MTAAAAQTVRVWDKDFNLLHTHTGDISTLIGELTLTVDEAGCKRRAFRVTAVTTLEASS